MLDAAFSKLPVHFDPAPLRREVAQFAAHQWRPDRLNVDGYTNIGLVTHAGYVHSDRVDGPMAATPSLERCPGIRRLLASFGTVIGEVRLRKLSGEGEIRAHYDSAYAFFHTLRVHLPITTAAGILFHAGDTAKHLAAGSAWVLDRRRMHGVTSTSKAERVHLVFDTVPTPEFWALVRSSRARSMSLPTAARKALVFDSQRAEPILPPGDVDGFLLDLLERLRRDEAPRAVLATASDIFEHFAQGWRAAWAERGPDLRALDAYRQLGEQAWAALSEHAKIADFRGPLTAPSLGLRFTHFLDSGAFSLPRLCEMTASTDSEKQLYALLEPTSVRIARRGEMSLQYPSGDWHSAEPMLVAVLSRLAKPLSRRAIVAGLPQAPALRALESLVEIGAVTPVFPWRSFAKQRDGAMTAAVTLNSAGVRKSSGRHAEIRLLMTREGLTRWQHTSQRYESMTSLADLRSR